MTGKDFSLLALVGLLVILLGICLIPIGCAAGWFTKAAGVVADEIDPKVLLARYEWFKNAAAALDKKTADIEVYKARLKALEDNYKGVPRRDWPEDDRHLQAKWTSELAGIKGSYNQLASEFNAQMAKDNYRFAEVGRLPQGASKPLPREYKPYVEN